MDDIKDGASSSLAETTAAPPEPESPPAENVALPTPSDEWGKVRELALKQLDRFMWLGPKVLQGDDPDAIHDIRVASRRLQQVLDLLYPPPPPREVRKLRRKIQRCRRALSEVRNCDVLLQRVEKNLGRKRTPHREIWTAVEHYLRERRAESFRNALRKLGKVNLAVFYLRLKECLALDGARPKPDPHFHTPAAPLELVGEQFFDRIGGALDRVWQGFETQVTESHRDSRVPVLHGARIQAKRLRYLIEVIHQFEVPGSAEALAWLRSLQQHLGDWHDLEVLEAMMIEMIARPEFLRDRLDIAMGAEKLILRNRATKRDYEEKYLSMTLNSAGFERLKEWVAYLLSSPSAAFTKA